MSLDRLRGYEAQGSVERRREGKNGEVCARPKLGLQQPKIGFRDSRRREDRVKPDRFRFPQRLRLICQFLAPFRRG